MCTKHRVKRQGTVRIQYLDSISSFEYEHSKYLPLSVCFNSSCLPTFHLDVGKVPGIGSTLRAGTQILNMTAENHWYHMDVDYQPSPIRISRVDIMSKYA
jgi:hypothetical protein